MRIEEIYRPETLTCEAEDTVADAARTMTSAHVGALAVLDGTMIIGVLSERDVVRAVAEGVDPATAHAETFATRQVQTAQLAEESLEVARRMLDAGIRHLPVVQDRTVVGMTSMRDLLALESWT
ncbi:MAG: CBS domain-containing protein [Actinomycetes bacterium]